MARAHLPKSHIILLNSSMSILTDLFRHGLKDSPIFDEYVITLMKGDSPDFRFKPELLTPEAKAEYKDAIYNLIMSGKG